MIAELRRLLPYHELIRALVVRDLKVRYRRSALGLLWTMLQPLLTMVVFFVVFSSIFRFDVENYAVYAQAGILFWTFVSQSVTSSMNSLTRNAALLKKVPVPREIFPVAAVISGVINLLFAMVPLLGILVITGHPIRSAVLFVPVAIVICAVFTLGAGLLLAPFAVLFQDTVEMVNIGLLMLMYLTPVFYPMSIVPDRFLWIIRYNPIRSILEVFRDPIYFGRIPHPTHLGVGILVALVSIGVGMFVFRKTSDRIPFYL